MCGRFTLRTSDVELSRIFHALFDEPLDLKPRHNIAPTQSILAVRQMDGQRKFGLFHWGLIPSWAKDTKMAYSTINARCETLPTKPAFRHSFKRKRCLIPADGFYEWEKVNSKTKVPHWFTMTDESVFSFAGLWDRCTLPDGQVVESATVITTAANELLSPYHNRMPVILPSVTWDVWLDSAVDDSDALMPLLVPFAASKMKERTVSSIINNARNEVDPRS